MSPEKQAIVSPSEQTAIISNLTDYQKCLVVRDCALSSDNLGFDLIYDNENRFRGSIESSSLFIEVSGRFETGKTPFPSDERNWQAPYDWVKEIHINVAGAEVLIPVSVYADMTPPSNIWLRENSDDLSLIFQKGSNAVLLKLRPIFCDDIDIGEYAIVEKLSWYIPMSGDSVQHSFYRSPNCN